MSVRHKYLHSEKVHTSAGVVELDENGVVTNLKDVGGKARLLEVPDFLDVNLFAPLRFAREIPPENEPTVPQPQSSEKKPDTPATDDDYRVLIADLVANRATNGVKLTTEGYIQMDDLSAVLREKSWPVITGTKRKELSEPVVTEK